MVIIDATDNAKVIDYQQHSSRVHGHLEETSLPPREQFAEEHTPVFDGGWIIITVEPNVYSVNRHMGKEKKTDQVL